MEIIPENIILDSDVKTDGLKADIKVIVKPPKTVKIIKEKKERTEGQKKAVEKMLASRKAKDDERKAIHKENAEFDKKERDDAVKKAEQEAKKITDNVVIQKTRGRPKGFVVPVREEPVRKKKEEEKPLTHRDYTINVLRQHGFQVSDDISPYSLKLIMARFR